MPSAPPRRGARSRRRGGAVFQTVAPAEIGHGPSQALLDAGGCPGSGVQAPVERQQGRRLGGEKTVEVLAHPGFEMQHSRPEEGCAVLRRPADDRLER